MAVISTGFITALICVCMSVPYRTIKLWDLEKFKMIGSSEGEMGPVR